MTKLDNTAEYGTERTASPNLIQEKVNQCFDYVRSDDSGACVIGIPMKTEEGGSIPTKTLLLPVERYIPDRFEDIPQVKVFMLVQQANEIRVKGFTLQTFMTFHSENDNWSKFINNLQFAGGHDNKEFSDYNLVSGISYNPEQVIETIHQLLRGEKISDSNWTRYEGIEFLQDGIIRYNEND